MNITRRPLKGTPGTIQGIWTVVHGQGDVEEQITKTITRDELAMYASVHDDLSNAIWDDLELCTEDYCDPIAAKYGLDAKVFNSFCGSFIRSDIKWEGNTAAIRSFRALEFDENGDPHEVLFDGRQVI